MALKSREKISEAPQGGKHPPRWAWRSGELGSREEEKKGATSQGEFPLLLSSHDTQFSEATHWNDLEILKK